MPSPIKPNFKTEWFCIFLVVISFLAGAYFYRHFPLLVPSHWNLAGQVDGYASPFMAAFLLPLMILGLYLLFLALPILDPKREQYVTFAPTYHKFKDLIIAFLFVLFIMTGLNGLGRPVNIGFWAPVLIGILFILIGSLLGKVKSNWFLGIRTPWTLSSETVWNKTHKLSGQVMMAAGLIMILSALVPAAGKIILFVAAILLIILVPTIYSYLLYIQEKRAKK
jgi:uncharacterized membrane protein